MDDTQNPATGSVDAVSVGPRGPRTGAPSEDIELALEGLAAADAAEAPELAERLAADLSDELDAGHSAAAGHDPEASS